MRIRFLLLILAFGLAGCATGPAPGSVFTLYLVRHAEKQSDGSPDPLLTAVGQQRAHQLADWFQDREIEDIWSSDFNRTRETAEPVLSRTGLSGTGAKLRIYDPGDLLALAEKLLKMQHNALVVGHSNTTPDLARLLCHCVIDDMDDSEHDRLIVVAVSDGETKVDTLRQGLLFRPR